MMGGQKVRTCDRISVEAFAQFKADTRMKRTPGIAQTKRPVKIAACQS